MNSSMVVQDVDLLDDLVISVWSEEDIPTELWRYKKSTEGVNYTYIQKRKYISVPRKCVFFFFCELYLRITVITDISDWPETYY